MMINMFAGITANKQAQKEVFLVAARAHFIPALGHSQERSVFP